VATWKVSGVRWPPLAGDDQLNEACQALRTCLKLEPTFLRAYRLLVRIHRKLGDEVKAQAYEQQYRAVLVLRKDKFVRVPQPRASIPAQAIAPAGDDPATVEEEMEFVVVSGLPRSGTSLMMQILRAGGIPVMTDELRAPTIHPGGGLRQVRQPSSRWSPTTVPSRPWWRRISAMPPARPNA